jgi:anaerobic ribonucleoside-triphosphate reductase activating protein
MKLKLAGILHHSVVDGPGLRTVVFLQGCPHRCPGCHNPQTQDPAGGYEMEADRLAAEICGRRGSSGVTLSGGEPFFQPVPLARLALALKECGRHVIIYSGYTYEQLRERAAGEPAVAALLATADILIDGPFIREQKDMALLYRGSRNQRIIDLPASIKSGSVVLSPLHGHSAEQSYA